VPWLTSEVCPICSAPTRLARICQACRAAPTALDGNRAACRFEGVARQAILDLKYRGVQARAPLLADLAAEGVARRPLAVDLLVPVPLAPGRLRQRGFNQSRLIADGLGQRLGWTVEPSYLERVRETPQQTHRSTAAERRENVADAFTCPTPGLVVGRRVALVDDVMTTGATLGACAEALKLAGASRVFGIVVAREV
jgi:ComF family protein